MRKLFLVILLFIGAVACDDSYKSTIPDVSFYFSCDLVQGEYSKLTIPGQFIKKAKNVNGIPVGYAGLIMGNLSILRDMIILLLMQPVRWRPAVMFQ